MGTKENPGAYDCYNRAAPNEPHFTLLARDELAPGLVLLWAALRAKQFNRAAETFNTLLTTAMAREKPTHPNKIREAVIVGSEMEIWYRGQEKRK